MEQHTSNTPSKEEVGAKEPLLSGEAVADFSKNEVDTETETSTELQTPPSITQEQRVEDARSNLQTLFENDNDTGEAPEEQQKTLRNALEEGLHILETIPQPAREALFTRHNTPHLMRSVDEIAQTANLNALNPQIISQVKDQLNQLGLNNPHSPLWNEVGHASSRESIRAEEILYQLLKHLDATLSS